KTFRGGVNVSVYDLNGDGRDEIIASPGTGGGPEIRVFAHNGNLINRFFAFDKNFRGGVSVAAGAFGRNGEPLIAVASGYGSGHVRVFNPSGAFTGISFFPFGSITHGLSIGALPIDGQRWQLIVAPERNASPTVKVFNLGDTDVPVKSFSALAANFRGGLRLAGTDLDHDGTGEIVVGAGGGGGPQVRIFTADGNPIRNFFAYPTSFRGGINVAAHDGVIYTGPSAIGLDGRADLPKYIEVDLSDQTLKLFENGRLMSTRKVSTGKWTTPTPVGTFAIKNKITMAYSKPYDLYMEWWMAFTPDGSYGLHALPFWKQANGGRLYEGVNHLGSPASHGCIRQSLIEAKSLFRWAEIGTTVIVKK
ncbi:MAG: L,D-transpeptidase, partial [Candidatus Kerfeldbacteria bacterium]|nr:L,D-transpeptidase [Candidatus Kerfeldbacteria bacterium]